MGLRHPTHFLNLGDRGDRRLPFDTAPVADSLPLPDDEWRAYRAEQHALIYAHFARQLVALIDGSSPRRFLDLAIEWELEALR
jgi:hypothetical protein